jgi:hypothetical protein
VSNHLLSALALSAAALALASCDRLGGPASADASATPAAGAALEGAARAACIDRIKVTANYKLTKEPPVRSNLGVGDTFEFHWISGDLVIQNDFGAESGTQAECSGSFSKHDIENLSVDGKTYITPSQPFVFGG